MHEQVESTQAQARRGGRGDRHLQVLVQLHLAVHVGVDLLEDLVQLLPGHVSLSEVLKQTGKPSLRVLNTRHLTTSEVYTWTTSAAATTSHVLQLRDLPSYTEKEFL